MGRIVECKSLAWALSRNTHAQGQVTKSEDMPRPDARGRGRDRGQNVEAEVEAEDKISASRTVWPRGLNITDKIE